MSDDTDHTAGGKQIAALAAAYGSRALHQAVGIMQDPRATSAERLRATELVVRLAEKYDAPDTAGGRDTPLTALSEAELLERLARIEAACGLDAPVAEPEGDPFASLLDHFPRSAAALAQAGASTPQAPTPTPASIWD